ncbi:MAG: undecaprenyldiphospho-muramoylpentapeptide beta-N-acetylglucosaminyltransferase [Prevotellaceae bacterium]|jgi:UDP-N-acetylglucosamine--N-acetylmuramyl-(pentapeptide) pyrophosphoryl-undecaprenol N-acetylglucosamine transferase|nr:undecaprenyldiphospho-muramoylpentapeptide beta-N-acetylglucosaminyltransferase [Prevotellaceae bacterium]
MSTKIIISGGGTGGHIFPAIAIAGALRQACPDVEILFVGAEGRMEMEKVPAAGYPIVGLPVIGIERKLFSAKNLSAPVKLLTSLRRAAAIVRTFAPDVVVGVGGYASAPTLWAAQRRGIPTLIQEQNSYAGLTNKLLARRAKKVCVAYEGMERFFPQKKIVFTGNPVRQDLHHVASLRDEAVAYFGLKPDKKTILIVGGSLGARTLNESILRSLNYIKTADVQLLWQTGERYRQEIHSRFDGQACENIKVMSFISRMDYAYAAADVVVSRAGAGAIAELCVAQKPCILIPSPNVAEDHQTANATALLQKGAALLFPDGGATVEMLIPIATRLASDEEKLKELTRNIGALAIENAAERIARECLGILAGNKFASSEQ